MYKALSKYGSRIKVKAISGVLILAVVLISSSYTLVRPVSAQTDPQGVSDTSIETGSATAAAELSLIEAIAEVVTTQPATSTDEPILESEDVLSSSTSDRGAFASSSSTEDVMVYLEHDSLASTSAVVDASTGSNLASSSGTTQIVTGDAYAYANVVNLTNTNIVNSLGFIVFLNQIFGNHGADVRDLFDIFGADAPSQLCADTGCDATPLGYTMNNNATTENSLIVSAQTGNNTLYGGTTTVVTGNAYAVANVTNIANTNIVDSNYMLLTFTNFGDLLGDVVLPGKHLLERLFSSVRAEATPPLIAITNQANLDNSIVVGSETGNNISSGENSVVHTGNAVAYTNLYNQVNTNVVNDDSFTLLFRVSGDWHGEIFGLPDGMTWERTVNGISITNKPLIGNTVMSTPSLSATIDNNANINNTISVSASTGGNTSNGTGLVSTETGDAYAAANVTNIANTNILGRNWSLLIFDILGNWNGNISFGKPDLWIGITANAENGLTRPGQEVTYTMTVSNLGDVTANNVRLSGNLNSDLMVLSSPLNNLSLGSLAPGKTIEKTITAKVVTNLTGSAPIDFTAAVTASEPDENLDNNTEIVTVLAQYFRRGARGSGRKSDIRPPGNLIITKTADRAMIGPGETVNYTVAVTNTGGPVFGAMLYDSLSGPNGMVREDRQWNLDTIDTNETVTITYSEQFGADSSHGTYLNRAQVLGYHKNRVVKHMAPYDSMVATVPLTVASPTPQVLGVATTSTSCSPYLNSYLGLGRDNDTYEVERLQTFLNTTISQSLIVNGVFDSQTKLAVELLQQNYKDDILTPWGLSTPTGIVYYTTLKKINELHCNNSLSFPLTEDQIQEISSARNSISGAISLLPE